MGSGIIVNLYDHIKYMMYTSIPSYIIASFLFYMIGRKYGLSQMDYSQINMIINGIQNQFYITPFLLLVPVIIVVVILLKFQLYRV